MSYRPGRATQPGGIGSLKSILGLLKGLIIRARNHSTALVTGTIAAAIDRNYPAAPFQPYQAVVIPAAVGKNHSSRYLIGTALAAI